MLMKGLPGGVTVHTASAKRRPRKIFGPEIIRDIFALQ